MGSFIARQPNGLLCRWSSIVDNLTHYDMTEEDYIEYRAECARKEARLDLQNPLFVRPFSEILEKRDKDLVFQCLGVIENQQDYSPEEVVEDLQAKLTTKLVDVFHNGEKVYVVPVNLSKGMAVRRLRKRLQPAYIIAAGDSEFDVSMVEESDLGLVPAGFKKIYGNDSDRFKETVMEMEAGRLFSETLLEKCLVLYFKEPD